MGMMINLRVQGDEGATFGGASELEPTCVTNASAAAVVLGPGTCHHRLPPLPPAITMLRAAMLKIIAAIGLGYGLRRFGSVPDGAEMGISLVRCA